MFQESTELNPAGKSNAINTKTLALKLATWRPPETVAKVVPVGSGGWKLVQSREEVEAATTQVFQGAWLEEQQPRNGTRAGGGREERPDSVGVGVRLFLKGYALREECYGTERVVRQA